MSHLVRYAQTYPACDRLNGDMNCNGLLNASDIDPFMLAVTDPQEYQQQCPDCDIMNADINGDGAVNSFDNDAFVALLAGGNAAKYVRYTWDAGTLDTALRPKAAGREATGPQRGRAESRENRLTAVEPAGTPAEGDKKIACVYDYLGRRIEKRAWVYHSGAWTLTAHRKFVWDGWLMLLELDGTSADAILRKHTWGLDLAGLMGSAGVSPANLASGVPAGRLDHAGLGGPALQGAGGTLDRTSFRQGQVGGLLNHIDIRVRACQLGCFE